jgi:hypothetical protein
MWPPAPVSISSTAARAVNTARTRGLSSIISFSFTHNEIGDNI